MRKRAACARKPQGFRFAKSSVHTTKYRAAPRPSQPHGPHKGPCPMMAQTPAHFMASHQTSERELRCPDEGGVGAKPRATTQPTHGRRAKAGAAAAAGALPLNPQPGHHMRCKTKTRRSPTPAAKHSGRPGPHTRYHEGCTQDAAQLIHAGAPGLRPRPIGMQPSAALALEA